MYDESEKRVPFGRNYCSLMSAFHFLSFTVVLVLSIQDSQVENYSDCVATIAKNFYSLIFLSIHCLFICLCIVLAKQWSQYKGALNFPKNDKFSVNWTNVQRAQFARRIGLYLRSFRSKMVPLVFLMRYALILALCWLLIAYIVICLGAPFLSEHFKTASFVTCLCLNSVWPLILIEGPQVDKVLKAMQGKELDLLGKILYRNALVGFLGAWLGAIPIPLDWDRPWQAWPLTCVLGTFALSFVSHIWSFYDLCKVQNQMKKSTLLISKKKGT